MKGIPGILIVLATVLQLDGGLETRSREITRLRTTYCYTLAEEAARNSDQTRATHGNFLKNEQRIISHMWGSLPTTGNLSGAGSDTSRSTLVTFVLACCAFSNALPKAWVN